MYLIKWFFPVLGRVKQTESQTWRQCWIGIQIWLKSSNMVDMFGNDLEPWTLRSFMFHHCNHCIIKNYKTFGLHEKLPFHIFPRIMNLTRVCFFSSIISILHGNFVGSLMKIKNEQVSRAYQVTTNGTIDVGDKTKCHQHFSGSH